MKVEIDLNEILGDESGVETLQDSVRRQVVDHLSKEVKAGIGKRIDTEIAQVIDASLKEALKERIPELVAQLMEAEYTPVDRWGDRKHGEKTTFRKELVNNIHEQMVYKKTNYRSDENAFTKAVDAVIEQNVSEFQKTFTKLVNETFTRETLDFALKELRKKFAVSA